MRITEVLLRPALGGAETLVEQLAGHWRGEGHTVTTVYVDPDGTPRGARDRVAELRRALRATKPDVVHAHSALPNLYSRLASRGAWPVVTVLHSAARDFDARSLRVAERTVGRWTSHVIAVSTDQVEEYRTRFPGGPPVTLVANGVRTGISARTAPPERLGVAVALSRLDPQKRIDVLLDGWNLAGLDAVLRIAGVASDPETQHQVQRWAAPVTGASLLGRVDDVAGLLRGADILVHTADAEAHPLAPIEAACAGLPVIVSTAVARTLHPSIVRAEFPTGSPEGLAATLHSVADGYADLARAAVLAAPTVAREFSLAACADQHLTILASAAR